MARIFITGSADGLGQMAAQLLVDEGHQVVVHGRHRKRAEEALARVSGAEAAVYGDLSSIKETKQLAQQVNDLGAFDAVIHNAAIGYQEPRRVETVDRLPHVFAINSLAPYILTCLIHKPERLIYLSSGMHQGGNASMDDLTWEKRRWSGSQAYSDSKLHNAILALAVARKWPEVYSNAVSPGWVATKMGGAGAPDSLEEAPKTQAWLASSNAPEALVSGKFFYHQQQKEVNPAAKDVQIQDRFLKECERLSGVVMDDE